MTEGTVVLVAVLAASSVFGIWRAARDGVMRPARREARRGAWRGTVLPPVREALLAVETAVETGVGSTVESTRSVGQPSGAVSADGGGQGVTLGRAELGVSPGGRATLLQFSTAFCQPCRVTRAVLADVASSEPGVRHVELDAESHLDLVRRLGIMRTPTVLVLDANGVEVRRATGAPRKSAVLAVLASLPAGADS